jgi:excisionase family DNA binding protein
MRSIASRPQLLTVAQAASLLNVSEKTIRRWVDDEKVPHIRLPSKQIRIPLTALLASLQGNYDLAEELAELDARFSGVTEDAIQAAMGDSGDS